jgi:hypothetical protein
MPDFDVLPMSTVSKKLANGLPLTHQELDACAALLNACENRLIKFTRQALVDAANAEQIVIELERLGLKAAA